jgi:exodeoxyribonuclease VII large subunit
MEEAGSGALQRAYEALKHRLGEEGLFDQAHKKDLPTLPQSIGVVSSPDGAAVHDILTVLNRRFPAANVILYPVAVQGGDSAMQIADAIMLADKRKECDVLIVSRGGGSLEDLWSFNDEAVARVIFASEIPIISAVGHEIDFTIADFVADVRAPTPSAAAEIAVPDGAALLTKIQNNCRRLSVLMSHRIQADSRHLKHLKQRLPQPQAKIHQQTQSLDKLEQQLHRGWLHAINNKRQQLDYWSVRLKHPQAKIDVQKQKIINFSERLENSIKQKLQKDHLHLTQQMRTLSAVSPLNTLERGYSITTDATTGKVIHGENEVELKQQINVRLQQGQLLCEIKEIKND